MILILLGLSLAGFVLGFLLLPTHHSQWLVGGTSLIVMVVAAILMIGNDTWHWGMHKTTTRQTTTLTSAVKNPYASLLLYTPVRHAKTEKVYVYRANGQTKTQHSTASLTTTNRVTRTSQTTARLVNQQQRWTYNNSAWRWLFKWTGHHHLLVKETNTFELPTDWQMLSVTQAHWLAKRAKYLDTEAQRTVKQAVKKQVQAAVVADPSLTKAQQAALAKKVQATATKQAAAAAQTALPKLLKQARQQSIYN
ncbi:DUF4811 domain-containing protein [Lactiplantibacillus carotarum]|uniref:DUF4811 domain-containing protein n=1 Tax=Lactiplantibacillus carotarum TaxID=2993456 RepID=UPI00298F10A3|nr:DUF4811 domain-containing protein [Lactiplantibacillus carotarum]